MNSKLLSIFLAGFLSVATISPAEEMKIDVSSAEAIRTTLQALTGKSVTLTIGEDQPVSGAVEAVGPDAVKIKELSGKEFYSAVVKLSAITSVSYRAK